MREVRFNIGDIQGNRDWDMVLFRLGQNIPEKDISIKSITVEYEPFDWIKHIEKRIKHNQLILKLLQNGEDIATLEGKSEEFLEKRLDEILR